MNANGSRWTAKGVHPGDERLAAFVDGRLSSSEREHIVAHLASCEDCYEVFSETVSFQVEADEEVEPTVLPAPYSPVKPSPWRRPGVWRRWVPAATLAAAAALTILVIAPWERSPRAPELPVQVIASTVTGADTAASVRQRIDAHGWPQTLGPESFGSAEATAFQLGVRMVELEVALTADDRDSSAILSHRIESLLENLELGEAVSHAYFGGPSGLRDLLDEQVGTSELLDLHREADTVVSAATDETPSFADPFWYAFGKWAEAGYLAAASGRDDHFRSSVHERFSRHLERTDLPPGIEQAFDEVDRLLEADETPAARLSDAFAVLIHRSGGGSSR